jgi:hypothetical protein
VPDKASPTGLNGPFNTFFISTSTCCQCGVVTPTATTTSSGIVSRSPTGEFGKIVLTHRAISSTAQLLD